MYPLERAIRLISWVCLGGMVGLLIAWANLSGYALYWHDIGQPPVEAQRITGATLWGVWLETASDKLYYLSAHNVTQGGWSDADAHLLSRTHTGLPGDAPRRNPASLSNVIDRREAYGLRDGYTIYSQYALRSDGIVYLWQDWPTPADRRILLSYPIGGVALVLMAWVFAGLRRLLSAHSQAHQ